MHNRRLHKGIVTTFLGMVFVEISCFVTLNVPRSFDHNPDREKPRPGASSPCTAQHTGTRPTARRDRHRLHYRGRERNRRRRSQHRAHARESRGRGRGHRRAPAEAGPTRLWGSGPPGSRRRLLLPLGGTVGQRLSASHFGKVDKSRRLNALQYRVEISLSPAKQRL